MSILIQIECDEPICAERVEVGGRATPIHAGDDPREFWIDQAVGLPEGWTESESEQPIGGYNDRWHFAHYCPAHRRA